MDASQQLNRTIWLLWLQGFEYAPPLVRLCARSWRVQNPTWTVTEIDEGNIGDFIDATTLETLRGLQLRPQKLANLIRIYLVSHHGGVWADATCYCAKPLDSWLPGDLSSGFFAFKFEADEWLARHPRFRLRSLNMVYGDKIMANWFIAACKGNHLASKFFQDHLRFFVDNAFPLQFTPRGQNRIKTLEKILNRNARLAQLWTSSFVIRVARVYPYFIFHYHFAATVTGDPECRQIWSSTPRRYAKGPLKLIRSVIAPLTEERRTELDNPSVPMYKLTWKYNYGEFRQGCVLEYLMLKTPGFEYSLPDMVAEHQRLTKRPDNTNGGLPR